MGTVNASQGAGGAARLLASSIDASAFNRATQAAVRDRQLNQEQLCEVLDIYIDAATMDGQLTRLEISKRVLGLVGMVHMSESLGRQLATHSKQWPAEIRNAIIRVVPVEARRRAFERVPPETSANGSVAPIALDEVRPSIDTQVTSLVSVGDSDSFRSVDDGDIATVLLMGSSDAHAANAHMLKRSYSTERISTVHELTERLSSRWDFCGFIIDESFVAPLGIDQQEAVFRGIGVYSSLAWIRIFVGSAAISNPTIRRLLLEPRHGLSDLPSRQVSFAVARIIVERELPDLANARRQLAGASASVFRVKGLEDRSAVLVSAAMDPEIHGLQMVSDSRIAPIDVELLNHGLGGATVAMVRRTDVGIRRIVKVGRKADAIDEARRFHAYVRESDPTPAPTLIFHADSGLVAFHAIVSGENPAAPAQTLKTQLENLWNSQYMSAAIDVEAQAEKLQGCVRQVAQLLRNLTKVAPPDGSDYRFVNPTDSPFRKLAEEGIRWGFAPEIESERAAARRRFSRFERSAVVHGDLHLQNVVVRAEGIAYLIDFAACGPGHPCTDLVRLELAFLLEQFRLVTSVAEFAALFADINDGQLSEREILAKHKLSAQCFVNRVCISGAVESRKCAIAAIEQYGGTVKDYADAKLLAAWQCMAMHGRQSALSREVIQILSRSADAVVMTETKLLDRQASE